MAKQVAKVTVAVESVGLAKYKGDLLAIGMFADTKQLPAEYKELNQACGSALSQWLKLGDFNGKSNETALLYVTGKIRYQRILVVGLGDRKNLDLNTLRQAAGVVARQSQKLKAVKIGLAVHVPTTSELDSELIGQTLTEGAIVGGYSYQDHLSNNSDSSKTRLAAKLTILVSDARSLANVKKGARVGEILATAQNQARMIANRPGCEINPPVLAKEAQKLARETGLKCKVFDEKKLAEMKMNGILAVGGGSVSKPRLIMLEYNGRKGKKDAVDAVVIGKAITFDSGGLSLKTSAGMEDMKFDKSGGCNVLGIMSAVAKLKPSLNVVGLIPSAENMPSHTSYRPGDIITTYSGKTVEVQNTDAEGRMILCDALAYAAKMKPKAILDMATLTGACVVALGNHHAGLFGNNDALKGKILHASKCSGEPVWPMPSGSEYLEQMKSKIADLKNVDGREGGCCTAAAFLGEFAGETPWVHLDIAGTADTNKEKPYRAIGATGYMVRLVLEYLRGL
jgi:leucyl aminopeptidase